MNAEPIVHKIDSWQKYLEIINDFGRRGKYGISNGAIFRGHANSSWQLKSKLERNFEFGSQLNGKTNGKELPDIEWYDNVCKNILQRFRINISTLPGQTPVLSDNELWAIGRHHGLLTPFLDWSRNPYIATFFAFYEIYKNFEFSTTIPIPTKADPENIKPVVVWKLNMWEETFVPNDFELIEPSAKIGSRIHAQEGVFTFLKNKRYSDVQSYLANRGLLSHLEKIELPQTIALEALKSLDLMGINLFRLFPDYIGAAEQANIESGLISQLFYILRTEGNFLTVSTP